MTDFVHLHVHSEYSLLDGACRLDKLLNKVKESGQKSIAVTDHGVMYGTIDFYKKAIKAGVKPIIGCEVYVSKRSIHDRDFKIDGKSYHLCLLCKDNIGYQNLIKLVSLSFVDGFYVKPRVDRELLRKYSEGIICLSGCIGGEVAQLLLSGDYQGAKDAALFYQKLFGREDYYIEIQDHGLEDQTKIRANLIKLANEIGAKLVATNDAHYVNKADSKMHKVLMCIQTGTTLKELKLDFETDEFYIKTGGEMLDIFSDVPESVTNTLEIAEKCNVSFEFGVIKLPYYLSDQCKDNNEYFKMLCHKGLENRYGKNLSEELIDRLDYEMSVIGKMGYVDYFLIVYDFVKFARDNNIPVGPGRGSGAGSIVAYCMEITDIDPIKYNLIFERFLNPERISMPDFDIDFCYENRQKVINYVINKYGVDHVAQIVTFGTMAARISIRDVARVLEIPYQTADLVARAVPTELNITIDKALDVSVDFEKLYNSDDQIKELIDMAKNIEGMPRHTSTHAAGVVITKDPVDFYVPLQKMNDSVMTQFTMGTLEELGLLKMDFLGLRTLTVISDCEKMIRKTNPEFSIKEISYEDEKIYIMLSKGMVGGVFQFESAGMKQVLVNLKPENIEDLIAVISLHRPGPMDSIPRYIKNRHNPDRVTYKSPLLKDILKVTYGCIVYQEQVMQICRELAGYSYGRADLVRRAMSKKKADIMDLERKNFVYGSKKEDGSVDCKGAINNGVSEKVAHEIFDEMNSFAAYAFNKSHATAYAILSYQTAYMKYHYPKEYMAALLTSVLDNTDKVIEYIEECNKMNIQILPPDINESYQGFTVSGGGIRFGLVAVKNIGRGFIAEVIKERELNGEFTSLHNFCKRMYSKDLNRKNLESLIKCGAMDNICNNRRSMLEGYNNILNDISYENKCMVDGQLSLFNDQDDTKISIESENISTYQDFSHREKLDMEKEVTGLYISGHPLDKYSTAIFNKNIQNIMDINMGVENKDVRFKNQCSVEIMGVITNIEFKSTRAGDRMGFVVLEDRTSSIGIVVFSSILEKYNAKLKLGEVVILQGRISLKDETNCKIIANSVILPDEYIKSTTPLDEEVKQPFNIKRKGLYLKIPSENSDEMKRSKLLLEIFCGQTPVYVYFCDKGKLSVAPQQLWVDLNDVMVSELKNIIGDQNVAVIL